MKDLKSIFSIWSVLGMILSIVLFFYTLSSGEYIGSLMSGLIFLLSLSAPLGKK